MNAKYNITLKVFVVYFIAKAINVFINIILIVNAIQRNYKVICYGLNIFLQMPFT